MPKKIVVYVVDYGRRNLYLRYIDPDTGKQHTKSSGTSSRKKAAKEAAKWEHDLREGRASKTDGNMPWDEFRRILDKHVIPGQADTTGNTVRSVLNVFEKIAEPHRLRDINRQVLSEYISVRREEGKSPYTISGDVTRLMTILRWAQEMGYISEVPRAPRINRSKRQKAMKGRPISPEEYKVYCDSIETVVGKDRAHEFRQLIEALWLSGLRLSEALNLWWNRRGKLSVDMDSSKYPMLWVPADEEKGHQERVLPLAPEFCKFLDQIPESERTGEVFVIRAILPPHNPVSHHHVSNILADIGRESGIVVDPLKGKYVSAHDLRRSFGDRWASRIMPRDLMVLMRHESIDTTMRYYVGRDAESTSEILWKSFDSGN